MNNATISKNIWHLTTNIMMTSIFSYVFWFFTAKVAGPEAIGTASYLASLSLIITTIDVLDMSLGMKRSLGMAIANYDYETFKQILTSTIIFVSITVAVTVVLFEIPSLHLFSILKIDKQYHLIFIALIIVNPYQIIFTEALIAALRARHLQLPLIFAALIRFPLLLIAVYLFHMPVLGTVIAYSSFTFITGLLYAFYSIRIFVGFSREPSTKNFFLNTKNVLRAGLASWFPHVIYILGSQLGIVTVVASSGESEGGKFYLAMGIFLVMLFIVMGISRVIHASISSIADKNDQANLLSYYMKITFMFTMPLAAPLLFFSKNFMSIMGKEYGSASSALTLFMIGVPMSIISEMVYYFTYGRGQHKILLYLGLVGNIPRIVLYFILPVFLGINGTALAYLTGSACQLVLSIYIQKYHLLKFEFKKYVLLTSIPISVAFVTWIANINFIISTVIIVTASILIYIKLHLFTDNELHNVVYMMLPLQRAEKIYPKLSQVMRKVS